MWAGPVPYAPNAFVDSLKRGILRSCKLAHYAVVGIDRDLLFVLDLKQSRLLLYDLEATH
jgi:6-phosphogluconolactonase (cycloisomerase 2 family)